MGTSGNVSLSVAAVISLALALGLVMLASGATEKLGMLLKALQIAP